MNFNQAYNRQQYLCFFRDELLPEDFETCDEKIEVDFQSKFIKHINKIGESSSLEVNVYEITHKSENDPRISLSRESFRLLSQYGIKRALVLFVPENKTINYRLSLITIDLKWEEGTQVKKEYSNPHRYSFFLGPGAKTHTPEYYLVQKGRVRDFDDLKNRFSIEVVNKDFYIEIACLFTELAGGERTVGRKKIKEDSCLSLPYTSDENLKKEFAVRLIGRLIFCWFLKKKNSNSGKPLIPEELLSTQSVKQNPNFYHTILEPLFFGTLNTPSEDRNELYKDTPWDQIPFLNGGLFEPGIHDFYDIDEGLGISKNINTLKVPDSWLTALFEIFETYNFTIDENTSVDIELSIEPEMLGRIFENLLAEINPETGETARKSTGSYYTPRPIVDFMVNESLKQYLLTKTDIEEDKISSLLAYEEETVELSDNEQDVIIDALDSIKIIDPACGSGAFPMGILQKMLLILQKIDPESKKWANKKIARINDYILQQEFQKKVEEGNWDYLHKLGIIQNSIYGVDIQSIAVDISKLRFFLSLIVDENVDDSQENRGIKPLPNLEFKFVCANSLIGLPGKNTQVELFEEADNIKDLRKLREEYFRAYGKDKKKIEKKFQEIQDKMFISSLKWLEAGEEGSQSVKLSLWKPFSGEKCEWFDQDWMFGVKDGFDVVIANPPYIEFKKLKNIDKKKYKILQTANGKYDIFVLFVEISKRLLTNKGHLVYIMPTTFMKKDYGYATRKFIMNNYLIIKIYDFADIQIFENTTNYTGIFIFKKTIGRDIFKYHKYLNINHQISIDEFEQSLLHEKNTYFKEVISVDISELSFNNWNIQSPIIQKIVKKIHNISEYLDNHVKRIFEGISSGKDEVFYINKKKMNDLKLEEKLLEPILKGRDIRRYKIDWSGFYVLYPYREDNSVIQEKELKDKYPNVFEYLTANKRMLSGRDYFNKSSKLWYELWNQRSKQYFRKLRIVCPEISNKNCFMLTDVYFGNTKTYHIILKDNNRKNCLFFLGLLNSSLIDFMYKTITTPHAGGFYAYKTQFLKFIPIKKDVPLKIKDQISLLVYKIVNITSVSKNYSNQESDTNEINQYIHNIDQIVYELYELTDDEIEIVENFNKK